MAWDPLASTKVGRPVEGDAISTNSKQGQSLTDADIFIRGTPFGGKAEPLPEHPLTTQDQCQFI
jgi:hypothetical protein